MPVGFRARMGDRCVQVFDQVAGVGCAVNVAKASLGVFVRRAGPVCPIGVAHNAIPFPPVCLLEPTVRRDSPSHMRASPHSRWMALGRNPHRGTPTGELDGDTKRWIDPHARHARQTLGWQCPKPPAGRRCHASSNSPRHVQRIHPPGGGGSGQLSDAA